MEIYIKFGVLVKEWDFNPIDRGRIETWPVRGDGIIFAGWHFGWPFCEYWTVSRRLLDTNNSSSFLCASSGSRVYAQRCARAWDAGSERKRRRKSERSSGDRSITPQLSMCALRNSFETHLLWAMTPAGPTYYTGARANFSRKLIKLELIIIKSLSPPIIALLSGAELLLIRRRAREISPRTQPEMAPGSFRQTVININLAGVCAGEWNGYPRGKQNKTARMKTQLPPRCTLCAFPLFPTVCCFFAPRAQSPGHYLSRRLDI